MEMQVKDEFMSNYFMMHFLHFSFDSLGKDGGH